MLSIIYLLTLHHLKWVKMSFKELLFFIFYLAKHPTRPILRLGKMWKFKEGWWFCGFCRTGILAVRMELYNPFDRVLDLVDTSDNYGFYDFWCTLAFWGLEGACGWIIFSAEVWILIRYALLIGRLKVQEDEVCH